MRWDGKDMVREAVRELEKLVEDDRCDDELMHVRADQIILDYLEAVAPEVADAYENVKDAAGFWACA